jgi:putative PIN family toxin of toxin-antitoxin system
MSIESRGSSDPICVVFDTNVLISAVLIGIQAEYAINLVVDGRLRGIVSDVILTEMEQKLVKKFRCSPKKVKVQCQSFRRLFEIVEPIEAVVPALRDQRDLHVLGTALAAKADLILTTDRDLLTLKRFQGVGIIHPKTLRWTFS